MAWAVAAQPLDPRARGQARVSLFKKIKLSDDWRAHAWILSHCWPEQFSESRILQPAQPTWMCPLFAPACVRDSAGSFAAFVCTL